MHLNSPEEINLKPMNKKSIDFSKDSVYDAIGRPDLKPKEEKFEELPIMEKLDVIMKQVETIKKLLA